MTEETKRLKTTIKKMLNIAANIRRLREKKQISQEQLAALAGVTKNTVWVIETGRCSSLRMDTLCAIAEALKVTPITIMKDP